MTQILSRRRLAAYAADQLLSGRPAKTLAPRLASILITGKRQKELDYLMSDIAWELEQRGKLAETKVTTANPLTNSLRQEIIKLIKLASSTEQVSLNETVDSEVIGGIRIETASRLWDKTVVKSLSDIREAL